MEARIAAGATAAKDRNDSLGEHFRRSRGSLVAVRDEPSAPALAAHSSEETEMTAIRIGLLSCVVFVGALGTAAGQQPADRFEKVVRRMVQAINAEDYACVQQDFSKAMLDVMPREKAATFFKNLVSQYGKIKKLDRPRVATSNQAVFAAHGERSTLDIKVVLDDRDKIIGLLFLPHVPPIPVPDRRQTVLGTPFQGEWRVVWGGDTQELNYHHDVQNQRFAFDFVITDSEGKTHKGEGTRNEDFFAFGRPVLAPADGVVTDVITGVRDNVPGSMNAYSALGNAVVIEHRKYEVSVLAHFKQGSIRVQPGDKVARGQVLGLCGNSGNSSEAHIHYHLQNTPILQDGTGIRCLFDKVSVTRNGKTESKTNCSPVKGDLVKPEKQVPAT
jgi:murein DD-endopeptidase MepM/ murein hydrolase activator NlpD